MKVSPFQAKLGGWLYNCNLEFIEVSLTIIPVCFESVADRILVVVTRNY
jgi:hypothetical protein